MLKAKLKVFFGLGLLALLGGCGSSIPNENFDIYENTRQTLNQNEGALTFQQLNAQQLDKSLLEPDNQPFRFGPGDRLSIELVSENHYRIYTFVMPDGMVYFNLSAGVRATGKTADELRDALEESLSEFYENPQVNVTLTGVRSRKIWVLGQVYFSGIFPLEQSTTLLETLGMVGGVRIVGFTGRTEEMADFGSSFVIRDGEILPVNLQALFEEGDMSQNIYMRNGDYVYFAPKQGRDIYVLGNVTKPQIISYKHGMSLLHAIALSRGPTTWAYMEKIVLVRGSLTVPRVAVVDLKSILEGRLPDVLLEAGDIIWVPNSPWEVFDRYFWNIVSSAARSIAINEGTRAVSKSASSRSTITL